jgi:hypothetical protein
VTVVPLHQQEQTVPLEAVNDLITLHRIEMADMEMKLSIARELLKRHGVELEESDLDKQWADCRQVVETAFEFVMAVEAFREKLGTSKELVAQQWRR